MTATEGPQSGSEARTSAEIEATRDNYGLRTTVDTNKHPVVEQSTQLGLGGSKDLDFKTMRPTLQ